MIASLVSVLLAFAPAASQSSEAAASAPSQRWSETGPQLAAGTGLGAAGVLVGGLAGGLTGLAIGSLGSDESDCDNYVCVSDAEVGMLVGAVIGGVSGGILGAALGVRWAAPEQVPSRGPFPALAGAALGAGLSAWIVADASDRYRGYEPNALNAGLPVLLSTALGAFLADRAFARTVDLSVEPRLPVRGGAGARISVAW
jgi:hypothetical protein